MHLDPQSLLALHKVNLQLHFRLCELMRTNGLRWATALRETAEDCNAEFEDAITRALDARDWQAVGFVAGDAYWAALQRQAQALQRFSGTVVSNQSGFVQSLQDAITIWQKDAALALQERAGAMPVSALLRSMFEPSSTIAPPRYAAHKPTAGQRR